MSWMCNSSVLSELLPDSSEGSIKKTSLLDISDLMVDNKIKVGFICRGRSVPLQMKDAGL